MNLGECTVIALESVTIYHHIRPKTSFFPQFDPRRGVVLLLRKSPAVFAARTQDQLRRLQTTPFKSVFAIWVYLGLPKTNIIMLP